MTVTRLVFALVAVASLARAEDLSSVRGTVALKGAPPKTPEAKLPPDLGEKDKSFCLKKSPLVPPFYVTDANGRLKDVVVWLEGVKAPAPPPSTPRSLVNVDCRFDPHVQAVTVGDELKVENRDPLLHNTHPVYLGDKSTLFNIALPEQGQEVKKKVKKPGVLKVQCDAGHVWMRAFVHVFDHRYHATTGADGSFTITDVPPGKYVLKAWHEAAGTLSQDVEVTASGPAQKDLSFDVKPLP
ncbi:MAG: carboxypeptidase regulatory-like domain-containing protein [Myxococcaceae bacterium]|nr:carboxypeptidase regulatory-like domain-containing protein [Myxococcaceae bacterium]